MLPTAPIFVGAVWFIFVGARRGGMWGKVKADYHFIFHYIFQHLLLELEEDDKAYRNLAQESAFTVG